MERIALGRQAPGPVGEPRQLSVHEGCEAVVLNLGDPANQVALVARDLAKAGLDGV